ncbi:MAG: hypothetical protein P1U29_03865 [Candidatus Pelagibacter bacterium]|jgi:hypothetical protein|nr:hypothetical protein [Candidatus Pelagibacter bacterium]|tara:strand:- start:1032 stop:1307 length:276 start_codon:yes stop_codon:yes gene_type:complete
MKNKFIVYGLLAGGTYLAYKHFTKKSKMDINDINVFVETDEKEIQPPVKEVPIIKQEKKILKELVKDKVTIGKGVGMWSSRDAKSYMDRFQ